MSALRPRSSSRDGLDLPSRTDVPTDHHAVRRLVGEHTRPPALAAVHAPVVDVSADVRFEHRLLDWYAEQVVILRLDAVEPLGKDPKCSGDRCIDNDLQFDRCC